MPLQRGIRIRPNISSNSNEFNVVLPVLSKKIIVIHASVTGLLDELGWLPLFERRKHSRLTVFYKAFNNLSAISLDHLSVSSRHTRASNENKFMSLPVRTDAFKYSFFFSDHYRLEFPPTGCLWQDCHTSIIFVLTATPLLLLAAICHWLRRIAASIGQQSFVDESGVEL